MQFQHQPDLILNAVGIGIEVVNEQGLIVFANPEAARLLGWPLEELLGKPAHRISHHTKADGTPYPHAECTIALARRDGMVHHGDDEIFWRRDGTSFPIAYTSSPLRDDTGQIIGTILSFQDITARKQAEAEVKQRQQEADVLAELARNVNASLDLDTVLRRVAAGARMLCQSDTASLSLRDPHAEAMVVGYWDGLNVPASAAPRVEPGQGVGGQVLVTGRPFRTDHYASDPRVSQDFRHIAFLQDIVAAMAVPIWIGARIEGLLHVSNRAARPFTDHDEAILQRLAEHTAVAIQNARLYQQQAQRQAELHTLLDINKQIGQTSALAPLLDTIAREAARLLDVPVAIVRQREGDDLVLASFWGEAVEMTLRPRLKIGEHLSGLVAASQQPVIVDDVSQDDRITPESRAFRLQYGLLAYLGVPLVAGDEVVGILTFHGRKAHHFAPADVEMALAFADQAAIAIQRARLYTQLQQAYDDLQQTQKIVGQQERLRALGQMASGIAHDINNALSPVTLYVEVLLRSDPTLSTRAREYLTTVQRAVRDVAHTIERLQEFSRPPAGFQEALPVDLNQIVPQVIGLTRARWRDQSQQRGITITVLTVREPHLPRVRGIANELREALINLVFNAIDAMPHGGTLTLQTRATPTAVLMEVIDTGVGMDEVTRQRCLEPFYTTKGERGTGLGLSMVYGVLERHTARLVIESAVGQGTTMRLLFPIASGDGERPAPPVEIEARPSPLRLLVIDDDALLRQTLQDVLQSEGHLVTVAEGGVAGLAAFRLAQGQQEPFHVVITDLGMPGMDGREVARVLKQASPETPVILLTGWGETLRREGSVPPHVDYLLSKPPKLSDLRAALVTVTASQGKRTGHGHT